MSDYQGWQQDLLDDLSASLRAQEDVKALILNGSLADEAVVPDEWSDIDLTAIVSDSAIDGLFSQRSWMEHHGHHTEQFLWGWTYG